MTSLHLHPRPRPSTEDDADRSLADWIRDLYEAAGSSDCLFASPLGPLAGEPLPLFLPQLVYFGPSVSPDPVRLAVLSGFDRPDFRGSRALLTLVSDLATRPDIGPGLSVSIFPVVHARALAWQADKPSLAAESWKKSREPEIVLLRTNAAARHYQGFILVRAAQDREPSVTLRTALSAGASRSNTEVYTAEDFAPWPCHFETLSAGADFPGPISLAKARGYSPFEVELSVPVTWDQARWNRAIVPLLKKLLVSYRGYISYGGNL